MWLNFQHLKYDMNIIDESYEQPVPVPTATVVVNNWNRLNWRGYLRKIEFMNENKSILLPEKIKVQNICWRSWRSREFSSTW